MNSLPTAATFEQENTSYPMEVADDDLDAFDFRRAKRRPSDRLDALPQKRLCDTVQKSVTSKAELLQKQPLPEQQQEPVLHEAPSRPSNPTPSSVASAKRFECVICCADLDGLLLVERIQHTLRCRAAQTPRTAAHPLSPSMANRREAPRSLAQPPNLPMMPMSIKQSTAIVPAAATPAPMASSQAAEQEPEPEAAEQDAEAEDNPAEASPEPPPPRPPPPQQEQQQAPPPEQPLGGADTSKGSDGGLLQVLMASARNVWGKKTVAPAVTVAAPPPPPRDAFAALMQASTSNGAGAHARSQARSADHSARGAGRGGGGKGAGRSGGRGSWGGGAGGRGKSLAAFKRVEGTRFVVDGFTCGASSSEVYFLTHFHADHYMGLNKRWGAPIHASAITAALVTRRLGIPSHLLIVLPMDTPTEVDGVQVTCIDANHCPGAVLLLIQTRDGRNILHTGDFRYEPSTMALHPAMRRVLGDGSGIDVLYLDTTYLKPAYRFPTQAAAVSHVVDTCKLLLQARRTLVLFGSYSIGKERVFLQVGRELGVRIGVDRAKYRLIECMQLPSDDLARLFPLDAEGRGTGSAAGELSRWRVVPMVHLRAPKLRALLAANRHAFDAVVAFRPSGWCFQGGSGSAAGRTVKLGKDVTIVEVPYSEHSSFDELRMCVRDLRPRKVIATVDGGRDGLSHSGMQLIS